MKLLLIEDEPKVVAFIRQGLEEQGYSVEVAYDGIAGEKLATTQNFDLILLDIILPYLNGIELCKKIRAVKPDVPVLMLTALGTTDDKVTGFEAGADDYLVKPFEFKELLARIKSLTKRISGNSSTRNIMKTADLELDLDKKMAYRGDKKIELTAKEFLLLEYLMQNRGRVIPRAEIAEHIWEITFDTGTNVIDVYINILRKKIDKDFDTKLIHTRIGLGYILQEE
jgi:two-component system copper resistance phosphate regulon response regulator CusR